LVDDSLFGEVETPPDYMILEEPEFPPDFPDSPDPPDPPEEGPPEEGPPEESAKIISLYDGTVIPPSSIQEERKPLSHYVVPLGEAMKDRKSPEWLVEGLLPKGAFVVLAGEPKRARKTLLTLHLALCLAKGEPFLGFPTKRSKVVIANMEDGYQCLLERFWAYGVREDNDLDIHLLRDDGDVMGMIGAIADDPPDALLIDPMMELELEYGVKSENDATDMGRVLRDMRNLARRNNTLVFLAHHSGTKSEIRGSSAFRGSTDGWFTLAKRPKSEARRLAWWLRRAPEGYVDVSIDVTAGEDWQIQDIEVDCISAPVLREPEDESGKKAREDREDEAVETFNAETYSRICAALQEAGEPVTQAYIRKHARVKSNDLPRALDMLTRDGLIEVVGDKRKKYSWVHIQGSDEVSHGVSPGAESVSPTVNNLQQESPLDLF
jgi:hypothetical protein